MSTAGYFTHPTLLFEELCPYLLDEDSVNKLPQKQKASAADICGQGREGIWYDIQKGDTVQGISLKFDVKVKLTFL